MAYGGAKATDVAFAIIGSAARIVHLCFCHCHRHRYATNAARVVIQTPSLQQLPVERRSTLSLRFRYASAIAKDTAVCLALATAAPLVASVHAAGQADVVLIAASITAIGMLASSCRVTQYRAHDAHRYASPALRGRTVA